MCNASVAWRRRFHYVRKRVVAIKGGPGMRIDSLREHPDRCPGFRCVASRFRVGLRAMALVAKAGFTFGVSVAVGNRYRLRDHVRPVESVEFVWRMRDRRA